MSLASSVWSYAATYYSKAAATNFASVASWGDQVDGSGAAPGSISNADDFVIQNGSAMTLNASASVRTLVINAGSLTISANTLTVAIAGVNNSNFIVNAGGTLTVSGGTVNIDGSFQVLGTAAFNHSGGSINVDGNAAGNAANSVASGQGIVTFTSSVLNLTGGTLTIVDPHANTTASLAFNYNNGAAYNSGAGHTFRFGNGVSTDAGGNATNGFRHNTWFGSGRFLFGQVVVDALAGTNRFVTSSWSHGMASLTVNSGEYRTTSSPCAIAGNITVGASGTLTANSTVQLSTYLAGVSAPTSNAQTISGAGVFRNSPTVPTANFTSLTVNNSNASGVTFSGANSLLSGANTGTVSGTLNFTTGVINTSGGTFILGINNTTPGTFNYTSGGFTTGSTFRRFVTTTTITVNASATTNFFPFVSGSASRMVRLNRNTGATNTAGWVEASSTAAAGLVADAFADGAYNVDQRTNASWTFASGGGFSVSTTLNLGLSGDGLIVTAAAPGAAPRLIQVGVAAGTHLAGSGTTSLPFGNRNLSLAQFAGTHYLGINNADIGLYSIASGPWTTPGTWSTGAVPTATDNPLISGGNVVTLAAAGAALTATVNGTLTLNAGGVLTVDGSGAATGVTVGAGGTINLSGGTLNVGLAGNVTNDRTLAVNGTLNVVTGTVNVYGNLAVNAGSTFNQSGGNINVDGNAGGNAANSVPSGTNIVQINSSSIPGLNLTGGTMTIVDPHANTTASGAFHYNGSVNTAIGFGHTLRFGDGVSTDAGGNATAGFRVEPYQGTARLLLGDVVMSLVTNASNRYLTGQFTGQVIQVNNLTVNSGSEWRHPVLSVRGNLVNNGTITTTNTLAFAYSTLSTGTYAPSTIAQSIGGSGVFQNGLVPTANAVGVRVENTSVGGVTLNVPLTQNGALNMIDGKINTTGVNILRHIKTGAANNVFTGTGTAAYVNGPFQLTIPASFTNAVAFMPVGKTAPNWLAFFNVVTNAGGPLTLQAETNNSIAPPSTVDLSLLGLTAGREWVTSIVSGAANLTSFSVQVYDPSIASGNVIAAIQAPATDFSAFGAGSTFFGGGAPLFNALALNVPPIAGSNFPDRMAIGLTGPLNVTNLALEQSTVPAIGAATAPGSTNNNLARLILSAVGSSGTIALDEITFTYTGTAPALDIPAVTLWTGTFTAPTAQIASSVISAGTITFTGLNTPIVAGNNYLWVRFNVSGSAALGNTVDVSLVAGDANTWILAGGATANPPLPATNQTPAGSVLIDYCTPTYASGCGLGDEIARVLLAGSTITVNNGITGCSAGPGYYTYYSALNKPDLEQGATYSISITVGADATQYSRVWVDFDQDGDLEAGESFSAGTSAGSGGTSTFNIIVPPGATLGNTRMRVRAGDDVAIAAGQACGASGSGFGETEDYIVTITSPAPKSISGISAQQQTGGVGISSTNNNLLRVDLNVAGSTGTLTLNQMRFTYTGTAAADIAAAGVSLWTGTSSAPSAQIGTSQSISGGLVNFTGLSTVLNSGANYIWLRVNTSAIATIGNLVDASIAIGDVTIAAAGGATAPGSQPLALVDPVGNRFIDYCAPTYTSGPAFGDEITNVSLNGATINLSRNSGASLTPFYTFFNSENKPDLLQGTGYSVAVTFGADGNQFAGIWIDYNNNGVFDVSEFSGSTVSPGGNGTTNIPILVPIGAVLGDLRMRVRGGNDSQLAANQACGASSSGFGETEDYIVTIIPPPNCSTLLPFPATATTASVSNVCNGSSVTFDLTVPMPLGSGITYQLRRNGANQGAPQSSVPFSHNVTLGGNWDIVVSCNGTPQVTASAVVLTVVSPVVTPGANVNRCGPGTLAPSASSATPGAVLRWYDAAVNGNELSSGPSPNTYTTLSLPAPSTQTYYVESSVTLASSVSGAPDPNIGTFNALNTPNGAQYQIFNTTRAVTIETIDLFPAASGDLVVELRTSGGALVASATRNITPAEATSTGVSVGAPVVMTLNFTVPVGTGWRLVFASGPTLLRNSTGAAGFYGVDNGGLIHSGNWFGSNNYWYFGYNWQLENRCSSTRSGILATVSAPPVVFTNVPSASICDGSSVTLSASGAGYTSFSWTPGPLAGSTQSVSPTISTTYVVTATGGGCNNSKSILVTVKPTPSNPVITPVPVGGICKNASKTMTTSSTTSGNVELFREDFNSGTLAGLGWTQSTSGTSVPYQIVTAPFNNVGGSIVNFSVTTPASSFVMIDSDDDNTSLGTTSLISPSFSTVGRSTVTMSFDHVYRYIAPAIARVDYSINNGITWLPTSFSLSATTPAQTWTPGAIQVTNSSFNLPAGALNQANVRVRFYYDYDWSWYWMIDNVVITANDFVSYRWSDNTGFGGIPVPQTVFSPSNTAATVTPTQGGPITYTVDVTNSAGCNAIVPGTHSVNVSDIQTAVTSTGPQRVGTTLVLSAAPTGGYGGYTYQWFKQPNVTPPGDVINSSASFNFVNAQVTESGTYQVSVTDGNGCTSVGTVQSLVYAALVWNGSQDNDWNNALNWTPPIVPANGTDCTTPLSRDNVVITNSGVAPQYPGAGVFVDNFGVESGVLTINNNVRVCGSLSGGNLVGKVVGPGSIELVGAGTNIVGGSLELERLNINKTGVGPVQIQGKLRINDLLSIAAAPGGINVNTGGNVILTSSATQLGKIGPIPGATAITVSSPGKFTQERYVPVPNGQGGRWYLLGSPIVGQLFTDYSDDFRVSGLIPGFGSQGGGILPSTEPERSTIFKHVESQSAIYLDTVQKHGWRIPGAVDGITNGQGYRVFIRSYGFNDVLDNQGLIHFGNKTFPSLTRNQTVDCQFGFTSAFGNPATWPVACQEKDWGWNLLSNPYPSPIDWDDADWTKPAGMNNAFFTWNSAAAGYQAYLGALGDAMGNTINADANANIITSSQGFFVKVVSGNNLTLSATEGVKNTTNGNFYRSATSITDRVKIRMTSPANPGLRFDGMIRFDSESTFGMDVNKDLDALSGSGAEFFFVGENGEAMWLNTVPVPSETKVIPMRISYAGVSGQYNFSFIDGSSISNDVEVYLKDNYLGTLTSLKTSGANYTFDVNMIDGSSAANRFEIIISPNTVTGTSKLVDGEGFEVYPNPASGNSKVTLSVSGALGTEASIVVVDVVGKVVFTNSMVIDQSIKTSEKTVDLGLAAGMYTVKVITAGKTFTEKLVVR